MPVSRRPIWPRISRLLTISRLMIWSVIILATNILGNIVANLLQERLGTSTWLATLPFALLAGIYVVGDVRRELRQRDASEIDRRAASQADPRRAQMIKNVRAIWITGFLEETLYRKKLIALGLATQPGAVVTPLDLRVQRPGQAPRSLQAGTSIIEVFDTLGERLLILGAPGAGKTTLLLDLAHDLLDRAERTVTFPVPVVFNLSSWARQRPPLADWLIDELVGVYDLPRTLAQAWVAADQVLPLLDGLDEVAAEYRGACVEVINTFRTEHGLLPLVVCSRSDEYDALMTRLRMQGAVVVQPLTREQVNTYLGQIGKPLAAMRAALRDDPALWELLDTPLMLSIMTLTYADQAVTALRAAPSLEARRTHLFAAYVNRMLQRRGMRPHYTPMQTVRWLAWLARQMAQHDQAVFYLERMQPDWLPARQQRHYPWGVGLGLGVAFGLGLGVGFGLFYGPGDELVFGLVIGLLVGLIFGLTQQPQIVSVEVLHWSWREIKIGLVFGVVFGLIFGVVLVFAFGLVYALVLELLLVLACGLLGGLLGMSAGEIELKLSPNQGIHRSAHNAVLAGLFGGLLGSVGGGLFGGVGGGLFGGVSGAVGGAVSSGLLVGMWYGGFTVIKHAILRLLLWRAGAIPWHYVRFLDFCAECILLRKLGGGYVFLHRLLMDYFAALETTPSTAAGSISKASP